MQYFSQIEQDKIINEFFNEKTNGIFIDIGAADGIELNNTYFFEKFKGWNGICIEPSPSYFLELQKNRNCILENCAISDIMEENIDFCEIRGYASMLSGCLAHYDERHVDRIDKEIKIYGGEKIVSKVKCKKLQDILDKNNISIIDYCSIDVEGAELSILKTIDFSKTTILSFSIENNYQTSEVYDFLKDNYILYKKLEFDDIYINKNDRYGKFFNY